MARHDKDTGHTHDFAQERGEGIAETALQEALAAYAAPEPPAAFADELMAKLGASLHPPAQDTQTPQHDMTGTFGWWHQLVASQHNAWLSWAGAACVVLLVAGGVWLESRSVVPPPKAPALARITKVAKAPQPGAAAPKQPRRRVSTRTTTAPNHQAALTLAMRSPCFGLSQLAHCTGRGTGQNLTTPMPLEAIPRYEQRPKHESPQDVTNLMMQADFSQ